MQLENTSAIVTGGASGLGAATAKALAEKGARVFALDLKVDGAPEVDGVTYVATDVTDPAQVQAAVDQAAEAGPLRTVVNCAGIGPSMRILGKKGPHDLELYATVVKVNLIGSFNVLTLAAEKIAQTDADEQGQRGVVVNTASIAAYDGQVGQAPGADQHAGLQRVGELVVAVNGALDCLPHAFRVSGKRAEALIQGVAQVEEFFRLVSDGLLLPGEHAGYWRDALPALLTRSSIASTTIPVPTAISNE